MVDPMTEKYRRKATAERKVLFWMAVGNFGLSALVTLMFAVNLIHHW